MTDQAAPRLERRLGLFDATMIVMGGIVGAGIFINPHVVAKLGGSTPLALGAWTFGGLVALAGAFVYAELAERRPATGGQYAYLRDAYHPAVAFVYGWVLLFVTQTGGMAAVAVTFANYFIELTHWNVDPRAVACGALAALTAVNCLGVRTGGTVQNVFMVLKIAAIAVLVAAGLAFAPPAAPSPAVVVSGSLLTAMGASLVPVLFAYGGWQTASFVAGELRDPRRDLPRGMLLGVAGVIVLYLLVNVACVLALGIGGLAASSIPASEVMRRAFGDGGARFIAIGIAVSTLGFLSQGMLTAPRVYFAMAEDGLFFRAVGRISERTHVPVVAIALQGLLAMLIATWGRYEQILSYVVSVDFISFGLTATCLFVFRRRDRADGDEPRGFRVPGHPWTTLFFVLACALTVVSTFATSWSVSRNGLAILAAGVPAYFVWRWIRSHR